ncbi:helix-turn-helix transcriptional regulator [bacterium]|nr:helix-turn-helix transcriptional regulator [bacterium]
MKINNERNITLGEFLKKKRIQSGFTLRKFAELLSISPAHMSDIENDHRNPSEAILNKMILLLKLDEIETYELYDLAAANKLKNNVVSLDLSKYIMGTENLRIALRKAKDKKINDKQWEEIIKIIEKI